MLVEDMDNPGTLIRVHVKLFTDIGDAAYQFLG